MILLKSICDCGSSILLSVGENIYDKKLYWHQSYHCDGCGKTEEMDCEGRMPENIRDSFLKLEGEYSLYIEEEKDIKKVEFILKKWKKFSEYEFENLFRKNSRKVICGTEKEVFYIKEYLMTQKSIQGIVVCNRSEIIS